jgi:type II secretion system protein N
MSADNSTRDSMLENSSDTPPKKSAVKIGALSLLFIFLVLLLTILKLPQVRITNLLQGYVQLALDPYGVYVTDRGRELSTLHGFRYTLDHPTLEFADQTRVELDSLVVSPNFAPLLKGRMGVNAVLRQGPASVTLDGAGRADKIDAKLDLDHVDIGKFGLLAYYGGLKGSGQITGTTQIEGALSDPTSLTGSIDLKIKNLKLDEQNVMGFQLPALMVSEGAIDIDIHGGKLVIKNVHLGKDNDDLVLALTGDITLNRFVNASQLNLKTNFSLSDKVKQSLALLDSLLGGGKLADGRYAFKIGGTLGAPFPQPDQTLGK